MIHLNTVMSYCTVLRKPRLSPIVHWRSFIVSCRSETSGLKQSAALIWIYRYAWLKIFLSITHILHCTRTKDVLFNVFHNRRTQHPSGCHSRCEACVWFVTASKYQSHLMLEYSNIIIRMLNVMWYHSCMDTRIEHARQFRERSALITMHFFTSREVRFCLERAESSCKSKSLIVIPLIISSR